MNNRRKRGIALILVAALLLGNLVINVFAEDYIPIPTDRGLARGMSAVYEQYLDGTIDKDTWDKYLAVLDVSGEMGFMASSLDLANYQPKDPRSGLEDATLRAQRGSFYLTFQQVGYVEHEAKNNFDFLMAGFISGEKASTMTEYTNRTQIRTTGDFYLFLDAFSTAWGYPTWQFYSENVELKNFAFHILDGVRPGTDGWTAQLVETGDADATTYQLRLVCNGGDKFRPANRQITYEDLAQLQLSVTMVSDVDGTVYTIPARAVDLDTDGILFDFYGEDWVSMTDTQLEITGVENVSVVPENDYDLLDIYSNKSLTEQFGLTAQWPVTDLAGNSIVFDPASFSVDFDGLVIDRVDPLVKQVLFSHNGTDPYTTDDGEADWSELFANTGDTIELTIHINEALLTSQEVYNQTVANITVNWNLRNPDGTPVTCKLSRYYNTYDQVGHQYGVLVFEPITLTQDMAPQGQRIVIERINNESYLYDRVGNAMDDPILMTGDEATSFWPDCMLFLDCLAPQVALDDTIIRSKTLDGTVITEENRYNTPVASIELTVPFQVTDLPTEGTNAGAKGTVGQLALSNPLPGQQIGYKYAVTQTPDFPSEDDATVTWYEGILTSEGTLAYSKFGIGSSEQKNYLHLKLDNLSNYEISDTAGLNMNLILLDSAQNYTFATPAITGIFVDNVAPSAHVNSSVTVSNGAAVLNAQLTAKGLNALSSISYNWTDAEGNTVQAGNITGAALDASSHLLQLELAEGLTGEVTYTFEAVVTDIYNNQRTVSSTMTVDLSKAISQAVITGDLAVPSMQPDIRVSAPAGTGTAAALNPMSRVTLVYLDHTSEGVYETRFFFRLFDADAQNEDLFAYGEGIEWYEATSYVGDNTHVENWSQIIPVEGTPDWATHYGDIDVYIGSSLYGLTVDGPLQPQMDDGNGGTMADPSYSWYQLGTVAITSQRDDVHGVEYALTDNVLQLTDAYGQPVTALVQLDEGGLDVDYRYAVIHGDMTGLKTPVTIYNTYNEAWGVGDVDFANSYAVLVRANADGTIATDENGNYEEVSGHLALANSATQMLTVPASDRNGDPLTTGAYTWVLHIAQKGGSAQTLADCRLYLLLDNANIPTRFGVLSHEHTIDVIRDGEPLIHEQKNADGSPLQVVNIGVAHVSETEGTWNEMGGIGVEIFQEEIRHGGQSSIANVYSTGVHNSLLGQHDYNPTASFQLSVDLTQEADYGTWLNDIELGGVRGIRFWNKDSMGDYRTVSYIEEDRREWDHRGISFTFEKAGATAVLNADFPAGWYVGYEHGLLTPEEVAAATVDDFCLALGSNTICYQLVMENGKESPIYQFQLNMIKEVPQVDIEYEYGPSYFAMMGDNYSYEDYELVRNADYINIRFADVTSSYSGLTVYYIYKDDSGEFAWRPLTNDEMINGVKITNGGGNAEGWFHTNPTSSYSGYTGDFFLCVDNSGNAVAVYPLEGLGNHVQLGDYPTAGAVYNEGYYEDEYWEESFEFSYSMSFDAELLNSISSLSLSWDGKEPVHFNRSFGVGPNEYGEVTWVSSLEIPTVNGAGLVTARYGGLYYVPEYDPSVAEGTGITHTLDVTLFGQDEMDGNMSYIATTGDVSQYENRANYVKALEILGWDAAAEDYYELDSFTVSMPNIKPAVTGVEAVAGGVKISYNMPVATQYCGGSNYDYIVIKDDSLYGTDCQHTFTDIYGNTYTETVTLPEKAADPVVTYSTTEVTEDAVTVTVTSTTGESLLVREAFLPEGVTLAEGTNYSSELVFTFTANAVVEVLWYNDETPAAILSVDNCYSTLEVDPAIIWDYNAGDIQPGNVVYGNVTAYLVDNNGQTILDPATGEAAKFTFYPGGPTSYTFTGCVSELGTPIADMTATLAVTLEMPPLAESDTYKPEVDVVGYYTTNGKSYESGLVYRASSGRFDMVPYEMYYGEDCYRTDMLEMIESMGWAQSYMFHLDIYDDSRVKLILSSDLYEKTVTYNTPSENIEGVSLVGRTLEISQNTQFVLYVVDQANNVTVIPFGTAVLGQELTATAVQVPATAADGSNIARVYLLPPQLEGCTNVILDMPEAKVDEDDYDTTDPDLAGVVDVYSDYKGLSYLEVTENGEVRLDYSFEYRGVTHTGSITVVVDIIDNRTPSVTGSSWSANYYNSLTNQDVVLQLTTSMAVRAVTPVYMADGNYALLDAQRLAEEYGVYITYSGDRISVIFEENTQALTDAYGAVSLRLTALDNNALGYFQVHLGELPDANIPTE